MRLCLVIFAAVAGIASTAFAQDPPVLADCDGEETFAPEPAALAPDMKTRATLLVTYDGIEMNVADRDAFLEAARAELKRRTKLAVVSPEDERIADKLVSQKRLTTDSPACGQAPPFMAVVAARAKHLIVADISESCQWGPARKGSCSLAVSFSRVGSDNQKGVPKDLDVEIPLEPTLAQRRAALKKLHASTGTYCSLTGELGGACDAARHLYWRVHGASKADPWLRAPSTLDNYDFQLTLEKCVRAPASFDATISIDAAGTTTKVALTPVTSPPAKSSTERCVHDALTALVYPCPRDGKPVELSVRVCTAPPAN
ncbi:hypothetical protein BH11MYX2_BH11MYX2_37960 [soil metagenome]